MLIGHQHHIQRRKPVTQDRCGGYAVKLCKSHIHQNQIRQEKGDCLDSLSSIADPRDHLDPILHLQKRYDHGSEIWGVVCDKSTNSRQASNGCLLFVACAAKSGVHRSSSIKRYH